jgi:SNF2 family DNA or RNA helicase
MCSESGDTTAAERDTMIVITWPAGHVAPAEKLDSRQFGAYVFACKAARCRFSPADRAWFVKPENAGILLSELARAKLTAEERGTRPATAAPPPPRREPARHWPELDAACERGALYDYQRAGARWLLSRYAEGRGAILADDMGLGKTRQALAALAALAGSGETLALVVAPAIARGVWAREAAIMLPGWRVIVRRTKAEAADPWAGIDETPTLVIVSYDTLPPPAEDGTAWPASTAPAPPRRALVVCDEAHATKNSKSRRTKALRALMRTARKAGPEQALIPWLLTGTPLLNRAPDLWSLYTTAGLAREAWAEGYEGFARAHGGRRGPAYRGGPAVWTWGGTPSALAQERFRRVALRRLKADELSLPPKRRETLYLELAPSTRRMLDKVERETVERAEGGEAEALRVLSAVRGALAVAKAKAAEELLDEADEQDEPLVVFAAHRAAVDLIAEREGWASITGDTPADERARIVERFQRGELYGVVGTIAAMGVGVTLTRSARVIFVEQDWTPALNEQAEDRCYRIGQTASVLVTVLAVDHWVDEKIRAICADKSRQHGAILGE